MSQYVSQSVQPEGIFEGASEEFGAHGRYARERNAPGVITSGAALLLAGIVGLVVARALRASQTSEARHGRFAG